MPQLSLTTKLKIDNYVQILEDERLVRYMTMDEKQTYINAKKIKEVFTAKVMHYDFPINKYEKLQRHLLATQNTIYGLLADLRNRKKRNVNK